VPKLSTRGKILIAAAALNFGLIGLLVHLLI
jgi:hypothetical protein